MANSVVAIANLLQMSSGIACNEDYADAESDVNVMPADLLGLYRFVAEKPRASKAGELFNYNAAETNLAGAALRAAIGDNLSAYLSRKIWRPLACKRRRTG